MSRQAGQASQTGRTWKNSAFQTTLVNGSRLVGLIVAAYWSACLTLNLLPAGTTAALLSPAGWELAAITTTLLVVLLWHAVRWPVAGLSEIALAFACGGPALAAAAAGVPGSLALGDATVATALCWMAGRMNLAGRLRMIPRELSEAALRTAGALFCGLIALWQLPALGALAAGLNFTETLPWLNSWPLWLAGGLCLVWCFDAGRVQALPGFTCLGLLLALMMTVAGSIGLLGLEQGWHWMPLVLACLPAVALWPVIRLHHRLSDLEEATRLDVVDHSLLLPLDRLKAVLLPLQATMMLLAVALAAGSLAVWTVPLKLAGVTVLLTAVAGRLLFRDRGRAQLLEAWLVAQGCGMVLSLLLSWLLPEAGSVLVLAIPNMWYTGLPLAAVAAGLMLPVTWLLNQRTFEKNETGEATVALLQSLQSALVLVCMAGLFGGVIARFGSASLPEMLYAAGAFSILCGMELFTAHRTGQTRNVTSAGLLAGVGTVALWMLNGTAVPLWMAALALVLLSLLLDTISRRLQREEPVSVLARPFTRAALALPVVSLLMLAGYSLTGAAGGMAEIGGPFVNPTSLTTLLTGCLFLLYGLRDRRTWCVAAALVALNTVFAESCLRLGWRDPQVFCMPLGASVLLLVELLRNELPANWRTPLRMAGGLTILLSPLPGVFDGSWLPLFTLMAASIVVTLLAIGLRVRSMTYLGTAFLLADLVGMVLRGSVDHPGLLWVAGLVTGGCVMALAAFCENHRELLASRLRQLAAELETWQ
ncbi:MAG: hypothetical protein KDA79_06005 [Planctomycetaceae bacterium]|nr:hypothetical protein [Planctomycetaceae bacterium]